MRIVRYRHGPDIRWGVIEDEVVHELDGFPAPGGVIRNGSTIRVEEVEMLVPATPTTIVAAAVNYQSHAIKRSVSEKPELFFKPPSSLVSTNGIVERPAAVNLVEAEGELVAVIGRTARNVKPEDASLFILGYTCGLDISARDWQRSDRSFWRAKGADTFSPIGPWIETELNPERETLTTTVNGSVGQQDSPSKLVWDTPTLVAYITQFMTLKPGDLIFTGTPGKPPPIVSGDHITVEVTGIGALDVDVVQDTPDEGE